VNFHTDHRAVVGFAFFGYLALTLLIGIIPAVSVQDTPGNSWCCGRSALAEQGRAIYLREGCGFCTRNLSVTSRSIGPMAGRRWQATTRTRTRPSPARNARAPTSPMWRRARRATRGTCSISTTPAPSCALRLPQSRADTHERTCSCARQ